MNGGLGNGRFHSYCRCPQPTPAHSPSPSPGNGGFHSYCRCPQSTPAHNPFLDMELSMEMMRILPSHVMITDDAKYIMKKCVFEFECFVICVAYEHCQYEQRTTITAEDVRWVMSKFDFDNYIEPLTLYLRCYHADDDGEHESVRREHLLKCLMVDPASSSNITSNGDASNGRTSQCADSDVESPAK